MVKGLGVFREHFKGFEEQYILIGGVACELTLRQAGVGFRATRDLDIVLCAEALTRPFVDAFWEFVRAGSYEACETAAGRKHFYRFMKPRQDGYPVMLELFARAPDILGPECGYRLARISVDDVAASLSAILLDDVYYDWILRGRCLVEGVPVVDAVHLIPMKAKAWLDLTARRGNGQTVDSRDIRKHRNDVYRLADTVDPEPATDTPETIKFDLRRFLSAMSDEAEGFNGYGPENPDMMKAAVRLMTRYGL